MLTRAWPMFAPRLVTQATERPVNVSVARASADSVDRSAPPHATSRARAAHEPDQAMSGADSWSGGATTNDGPVAQSLATPAVSTVRARQPSWRVPAGS